MGFRRSDVATNHVSADYSLPQFETGLKKKIATIGRTSVRLADENNFLYERFGRPPCQFFTRC